MRKSEMKYIALYAIPHALVMIFCIVMILFDIATPYIDSFCADTTGKIYVSENGGIGIYKDRVKVGFIDIRSDNFLINTDQSDNIFVVYTSRIDQIDMNGNVLKTIDDTYSNTYSKLSSSENIYTTENGDRYRKVGNLGWTMIVKNNQKIVYFQSIVSFTIKMLIQICTVSMFVNGIWMIKHVLKIRGRNI